MKVSLPLIAAGIAVLIGTWYHGVMTERWGMRRSGSLDKFTELVPHVPMEFGPWIGTEDKVDEEQFKLTNCTACIQRTYRHKDTGESVSLYLVSGSGRNITIHTPDWCYRASGFLADSDPVTYRIDTDDVSPDPEFATAVFRKTEEGTGRSSVMRIFWTYSYDGKWTGPTWAKLVLTRQPAVYKVYLIYAVPPNGETEPTRTPVPEFVRDTFAQLNNSLFLQPAKDSATSTAEEQPSPVRES
jgi:hypothetical protein